jgi:hypothetical protein
MDITLVVLIIYSIASLALGYLLVRNLIEMISAKQDRRRGKENKQTDENEEQKEREYKEHLDGLMNYDATQAYRRVK